MILSAPKTRRFMKLFISVLQYACGELGMDDFGPDGPEPDEVIDLCRIIWGSEDHRYLIADYVKENPYHFSRTDLREIGSWDQAVFGTFDVVRDKSDVFYLMGGHAFAIRGIVEEADINDGIPLSRVECLILPFDSVITMGVYVDDLSLVPGVTDEATKMSEFEACRAERRVVRTAKQLANVADEVRDASIAIVSSGHDDTEGGDGQTIPEPRPQHVGALAGLSWDERQQAVTEDLAQYLTRMLAPMLREEIDDCCLSGTPTSSMKEILSRVSNDNLMRMAERFKASCAPNVSKAVLVSAVLEAMPKDAEDFLGQAILESPKELDLVRRVYEAGGRIDARKNDADELKMLPIDSWPAVVVFRTRGGYAAVMPDMAREAFETLERADWDEYMSRAKDYDRACSYVSLSADMRGIVDIVSVLKDCSRLLQIWESPVAIMLSLDKSRNLIDANFDIVEFDDTSYAVSSKLVNDDVAPGSLSWRDQDVARKILVAHKKQRVRPMKPLMKSDEDAEGRATWTQCVADYMEGQSCYRELARYLDAHIPEGQNEYHFADAVLEELINHCLMSTPKEVTVEALEQILARHGFQVVPEDELTFAKLLKDFVETAPNWYANGWPATKAK